MDRSVFSALSQMSLRMPDTAVPTLLGPGYRLFHEDEMITFEQAREKAQLKLLALAREQLTSDFTILDGQVQERKRGWVFPYNTKRFVETKNPQDGLVGNGPIFVDRDSGEIYALPSGGYL